MKAVFVTNFISPHTISMCDYLYSKFGKEFAVIETSQLTHERLRLGYNSFSNRAYLIKYRERIFPDLENIIANSGLVLFSLGSVEIKYIRKRIKLNKNTYLLSERLFKRGAHKLIDPKLWLQVCRNISWYKKNVFLLTMGFYVASDFKICGFNKNKIFKFGYFTKTDLLSESKLMTLKKNNPLSIVWVGRLIKWKRPMDVILMAKYLKNNSNITFIVEVLGDGPEYENIEHYINANGLESFVQLRGICDASVVEQKMRKCNIFITTSNQREGWGCVINEAMSRACAVVVTKESGATKELVKSFYSGFMYKAGNIEELSNYVHLLASNIQLRNYVSSNAFNTLNSYWNAEEGIDRLIEFNTNRISSIEGLMSKTF